MPLAALLLRRHSVVGHEVQELLAEGETTNYEKDFRGEIGLVRIAAGPQRSADRWGAERTSRGFEVESVMMSHGALADVAVHAVSGQLSEDDLRVAAVLQANPRLSAAELSEWW